MQVPFHALTEADAVEVVLGSLTQGVGGWVLQRGWFFNTQTQLRGQLRSCTLSLLHAASSRPIWLSEY